MVVVVVVSVAGLGELRRLSPQGSLDSAQLRCPMNLIPGKTFGINFRVGGGWAPHELAPPPPLITSNASCGTDRAEFAIRKIFHVSFMFNNLFDIRGGNLIKCIVARRKMQIMSSTSDRSCQIFFP